MTEAYYDANAEETYTMIRSKQSEYDYIKQYGKFSKGISCKSIGFSNATRQFWSKYRNYIRLIFDNTDTIIGEIEYVKMEGKDQRVVYPYQSRYYENGTLIEGIFFEYCGFAQVSLPKSYYRKQDRMDDDPESFAQYVALVPVLTEWFEENTTQA